MIKTVKVRVPATTANLGPGFDCLALSLDLWNTAWVSLSDEETHITVRGEGLGVLPLDERNLLVQAFRVYAAQYGAPQPRGLQVVCENHIPLGSGLGSSASATLAGLLAARALSSGFSETTQASDADILHLADTLEGHPDNAAAALLGGLVVVIKEDERCITRHYTPVELPVAYVLPQIDLPTHAARAVLPKQVPFGDAVFNMGRAAMVIDALRNGDLALLAQVMQDRLHQPFRLPLIPGSEAALAAARQNGAAAAVISGAGPGLIAFCPQDPAPVAQAMQQAVEAAGVPARSWLLKVCELGAQVYAGDQRLVE